LGRDDPIEIDFDPPPPAALNDLVATRFEGPGIEHEAKGKHSAAGRASDHPLASAPDRDREVWATTRRRQDHLRPIALGIDHPRPVVGAQSKGSRRAVRAFTGTAADVDVDSNLERVSHGHPLGERGSQAFRNFSSRKWK
jgi:hypothetical protein